MVWKHQYTNQNPIFRDPMRPYETHQNGIISPLCTIFSGFLEDLSMSKSIAFHLELLERIVSTKTHFFSKSEDRIYTTPTNCPAYVCPKLKINTCSPKPSSGASLIFGKQIKCAIHWTIRSLKLLQVKTQRTCSNLDAQT